MYVNLAPNRKAEKLNMSSKACERRMKLDKNQLRSRLAEERSHLSRSYLSRDRTELYKHQQRDYPRDIVIRGERALPV